MAFDGDIGKNQEFQPSNLSDELLGAMVPVPFASPTDGDSAIVVLSPRWELEIVDVVTKIDTGDATFTITKADVNTIGFEQDESGVGGVGSSFDMEADATVAKYNATGGTESDGSDDPYIDAGDVVKVNIISASSGAANLIVELLIRNRRNPSS